MRFGRGSSDSRSKGGAGIAILIAIALVVIAWILSIFIRFALSRKREYLADAGSVELTKNPDAMISALRKIEGRGELAHASSGIMEMCIDNPRVGFSNMFATHPPIGARVAAIVQYMGGHDPGPIALPDLEEPHPEEGEEERDPGEQAPPGPWGPSSGPQTAGPPSGDKPFLPSRPPIELGGSPPSADAPVPGPWGPRGRS